MRILITGIAGFIGFHVARELGKEYDIIGIDSMTDFYPVDIKEKRCDILVEEKKTSGILFEKIQDTDFKYFGKVDFIIHLAAQAGVPFSQQNPDLTIGNNVGPTVKIFEYARKNNIPVIYASSSSVYEKKSLYALTKSWNEETAKHYKDVSSMGLRFFSIYGPYGRPDQVFYKWIDLLSKGKEIQINGSLNQVVRRNFTHISDVVGFIKEQIKFLQNNHGQYISDVKNANNISLTKCVGLLERYMKVKANINRGELKDYDPLNVIGRDEGIDGISIEDGLKEITEYLGVYNEK